MKLLLTLLAAASIAVALLCAGCAWTTIDVTVTHPDGKTMKAHYYSSRDSELIFNTNGTFTASGKASVVIDAQAKALGYVAGQAAEGAARGATKP